MSESTERIYGGADSGAGRRRPAAVSRHAVRHDSFAAVMEAIDNRALYDLFLLNIVLQMFDGMATYSGIHLGVKEANPLLRTAFALWGVGTTLLLLKGLACGLLLLLYRGTSQELATQAFYVLVAIYCVCSLVPWLATLFVLSFVPLL